MLEHSKKMEEIMREKVEFMKKEREEKVNKQAMSYDYSKY